MLRLCLNVLCAAALLAAAVPVHAQCSGSPPWYYYPAFSCDTSGGGACSVDDPVTFRLHSYSQADYPIGCASATWTFDLPSGQTVLTTNGAETAQTKLPAGTHNVLVKITNSFYVTNSYQTSLTVAAARGVVEIREAAGSAQITEGGSYTFNVARTTNAQATTVQWVATETFNGTTPTTDFSPASGSITLGAGDVSKPLTFTTTNDTVFDGNRRYYIRLLSATNDYIVSSSSGWRELLVLDDDFAIVEFPAQRVSVRENVGLATISVQRRGNLASSGSVQYHTSSGAGIVSTSGSLSFGPGETLKTFTVPVINDNQWTGNRSASLYLSPTSSGFQTGNNNFLNLDIEDDEPTPTVSAADVSVAEGHSGTKIATMTVKVSPAVPFQLFLSAQILPRTAQFASDYTGNTFQSLNLPPNTSEATVSITINGDTAYEPHETFALRLQQSCCGPQLAMPSRDPLFTILNDEVALTPDNVRIAKGQPASFVLDIGLPAASPLTLPLLSSNSAALTVPQSVQFSTGESRVKFDVTGKAVGASNITVQLPAQHGGERLSAHVSVHDSGTALFDPGSAIVFTGEETSVKVSLQPASAQQHRIPLVSGNTKLATVPSEVIIPAGGFGTFNITGVAKGATYVKATLPAEFGGFSVNLLVDVHDKPPVPTLMSIAPATGPTSGGTGFEARGALLTADCTLLFGGVPALAVALNSQGALVGTTPPHANGTVDVMLRCGASQFVLSNAFTYVGVSPVLSAIAPGFGSMSGGTHVRATVSNVRSGCWMFFGGVPAPSVWIRSATEMTAVTPWHAGAGAVDVAVRCAGESSMLDDAFAYSSAMEPSMSIIDVQPLSAAPGQPVTITGSRLRPTDRVSFDSEGATVLRTQPDAHVVRVPELPPGKAAITLVDAEGRVATTGPIFTVKEAAPPYIGIVTPNRTVAGGEVALEGRGFRPGFSFVVGGFPARIVSLDHEHAVLRLTGGIDPGAYSIDVRNTAGQLAASGPDLTIVAAGVVVRSITAACGTSDGGTRVTIRGSGFAPGASATFNGVAASVEFVSETELRATTPASSVGTARVVVTNPNGDSGAISDGFSYRSPFDPIGCATRGRSVRH